MRQQAGYNIISEVSLKLGPLGSWAVACWEGKCYIYTMSQSVRAEQSGSPLRFNAAVTVDVVIFTVAEGRLKTLLVKRKQAPYQGVRAITGGFLQPQETPDHAAVRILKTKAGIRDVYL